MLQEPQTCSVAGRGLLIASRVSNSARLHPLYSIGICLSDEAGTIHHFEFLFDRENYRDVMRTVTRQAMEVAGILTLTAASYVCESIRATAFYHGWI